MKALRLIQLAMWALVTASIVWMIHSNFSSETTPRSAPYVAVNRQATSAVPSGGLLQWMEQALFFAYTGP